MLPNDLTTYQNWYYHPKKKKETKFIWAMFHITINANHDPISIREDRIELKKRGKKNNLCKIKSSFKNIV